MFKGSHLLAVDDKGRIAIPTQFRQTLQEQCQGRVVVTAEQDATIVIYPWSAWQEREDKLRSLPSTDPASRAICELELGNADERRLDKQHRLLLAPSLREHAQLERDAILLGLGEKLRVRSQQTNRALSESYNTLLKDPANLKVLVDHGL